MAKMKSFPKSSIGGIKIDQIYLAYSSLSITKYS